MLAVFTYDNGAVIVAPPLAKDLSGWHSTNRSVSESEGTCGSFAAVAIEPPRATLSQTWGAHSLSFNFSGSSIFLYGIIDSSYSWSINIDGDVTGDLRSIAHIPSSCPLNFYNRTNLADASHSFTLSVNPVDSDEASLPGEFTFAYASVSESIINGTSVASVPCQIVDQGSTRGYDLLVIAWVLVPLTALAMFIATIALVFRHLHSRNKPLTTARTFPPRNTAIHVLHLEQMHDPNAADRRDGAGASHSRCPSGQSTAEADL